MALLALLRAIDPVDPDLIRATNESIVLDVQHEAVDWVRFETLCARPDAQSRLEALELYRGDFLAAFPVPALADEGNGGFLEARRTTARSYADSILPKAPVVPGRGAC